MIKSPSRSSLKPQLSLATTNHCSSDGDFDGKTYDTLDSLLLNLSPGFMKRVNQRLEERLWNVFAERQTNEASGVEEDI